MNVITNGARWWMLAVIVLASAPNLRADEPKLRLTLDVRSVAFSRDGKTLASGSEDNTSKLWDVGTGKERATFHRGTRMGCIPWRSVRLQDRRRAAEGFGGALGGGR